MRFIKLNDPIRKFSVGTPQPGLAGYGSKILDPLTAEICFFCYLFSLCFSFVRALVLLFLGVKGLKDFKTLMH